MTVNDTYAISLYCTLQPTLVRGVYPTVRLETPS